MIVSTQDGYCFIGIEANSGAGPEDTHFKSNLGVWTFAVLYKEAIPFQIDLNPLPELVEKQS